MLGFFAALRQTDDDLDGLLQLGYLFAGILVLSTLAFGLSVWLLRCPRCGASVIRSATHSLGEKSVVETLVTLLRRVVCPDCGYRESDGQD